LDRLEAQSSPAQTRTVGIGFLAYDSEGACASLTLAGERTDRLNGESEDAMRARALETNGPFDQVVWVSWIPAKDGKPAPGFERFAT
jgi:hypothetical protein